MAIWKSGIGRMQVTLLLKSALIAGHNQLKMNIVAARSCAGLLSSNSHYGYRGFLFPKRCIQFFIQ